MPVKHEDPGSSPGGSNNLRGHSSMVEPAFHQSLSSRLCKNFGGSRPLKRQPALEADAPLGHH